MESRTPVLVDAEALRTYIGAAFRALGYLPNRANQAAEVLTLANLRGVDSHGVANLLRIYAPRTKSGLINARGQPRIVYETPTTARIDADLALGLATAQDAIEIAIAKAEVVGAGFVAVERSTHFGMAAAHALRAVPHDMIGLAMTTAWPSVVPTGAIVPGFGTNPICVAVPAGDERPFVLDMATSVVAAGKIREFARLGKSIPAGWALGADGRPTMDPNVADAANRLMPLGGEIETSGYKGSGLAFLVDIFSGILSGSGPSLAMARSESGTYGHFLGAWRIDAFRPAAEFKMTMDRAIRDIRALTTAPGRPRIYVAGEIEFETEQRRREAGIPLDAVLLDQLDDLAENLAIERLSR